MAENDINNEEQYIKAAERLKNYISSIDFKFSNKEEIEKIYDDFREKYSPEKLAEIPDNYLVDKLFLSGNPKNLCHDLEFDRKYLIFGAIFGGSSFKYPIFKRDGKWITGNPQSFVELSQDEALVKARSIKDLLIKTYNVIKQYNFNTLNDYVNFYGKLEKEIKEFLEPLWVRKYYHMMFPNLFINFHKNELQEHILLGLGVIPGSTYYERCGQLIEVNKNLGWYQLDFSNACLNKFSGNIKSFYRIGSTDSNGKKYAEEWKEKGIVAIGWKELGDLRQYDNGKKFDTDKVKEKLLETNNNYKTIAPTKSKEIKNFYKSDENSIFVVADGEKIIGLVDNIGEYGYDSNNHMSNYKKCNWATIFQDNIKFPNKNEWYLTSCVKITNKENLLFLYNLYYWNERKLPSKIIVSTNNKIDNPINTILYGPPGTGKTYNTLHHALLIITEKETDEDSDDDYKSLKRIIDNKEIDADKETDYESLKRLYDEYVTTGRIKSITFHQSYGYEDFIEGIKPVCENENEKTTNQDSESKDIKYKNEKTTNQDSESKDIKYKIEDGVFKDFCNKKARNDTENNYVFIIDEINRGNISNIFGELITLIEPNKRERNSESASVTLPYSKEPFSVPNNVYIIGTMNTADRSIALLDTALRRRFDFIEMMPDPKKLNGITINGISVKDMLQKINERIEVLYDREHTIGHAYFMELKNDSITEEVKFNNLKNIFRNRIIPLLQEYFYEDYHKIQLVLGDNKKSDDYKFIKATGIESESLFGDKEIGDLPEYKYEINNEAFDNPDSYKKIYEKIEDENKPQNS